MDSPILKRVRRGEPDAWDALIGRYAAAIRAAARRVLGDDHLADDATQDVYVSLFSLASGRSALPATGDDEVRYIWAVALNAASRLAKRRARTGIPSGCTVEAVDGRPTPLQLVESADSAAHIRRAVAQLARNHRSVLELFYFEGRSYEEIGQALNLPEGTVKSSLNRTRGRLRSWLALWRKSP